MSHKIPTPLNSPNMLIYQCPVLSLCLQADITSDENQRKESSSNQQCLLIMSSDVLLVSLYIHIYIHIHTCINICAYVVCSAIDLVLKF